MVEIAKALSQNARVIIMDEPTSSLTLTETDRLLATIKELRTSGVSVIYISHRLGEIEQIADRAVALRDGRNAGELGKVDVKHEKMVALMVGRKLEDLFVKGKGPQERGYFQVEGLRTPYRPHHRISFDVAKGEILGFAGLVRRGTFGDGAGGFWRRAPHRRNPATGRPGAQDSQRARGYQCRHLPRT
jgi:ribose transport system ATP-binding protein